MLFFRNCGWCLKPTQRRDSCDEKLKGMPRHDFVILSNCALLDACWACDWKAAIRRLERNPIEAFYRRPNSGRTALHLVMMPGEVTPCVELIRKLVAINPHAVLVSDHTLPLSRFFNKKSGNTPIHFACANKAIRENPSLIKFLVETAVKLSTKTDIAVRVSSLSLLHFASSRGAPAETLNYLVQTRKSVPWIAPWTGTETIEESQFIYCHGDNSPLAVLCLKARRDIPNFPLVEESVITEMREIVRVALDRKLDHNSIKLIYSTNYSSQLETWLQIVTLFRNPSVQYAPHTILYRVCTLNSPLPDLVKLVCRLFPEQILQEASVSATSPEFPLHAVLRHDWAGSDDDSIQKIIRIIITSRPVSLIRISQSTGLYPIFLAASRNMSLDVLFDMMRLCPNVLHLQRISHFDQARR